MLNTNAIRKQFPILKRIIKGKQLIYLDNAATTQKPKCVIEALKNFYENINANVHRSIYTLSEEATEAYENSRKKIAKFINAESEQEIVFTRNATESINLVAMTWGQKYINEKTEIISSDLEHHSNLLPWRQLADRKGTKILKIPIKDDYTLEMEEYKSMLSKKTRLVCITAMSNVLGTIPQIKEIIELAHKKTDALVLVDGAQSIAHCPTDVRDLNCDFFVFSSHKMLGPTGVGVLYAKKILLEGMPPFLYGGDMVKAVDRCKPNFNDVPWKFEAGTPNIADVVAFGSAIDFLEKIGLKNIHEHDKELLKYAVEKFSKYKKVKLYVPPFECASSVLSFTIEGVHPHDIASIFNEEGICIRSGVQCAQPLMEKLKVPATARISFYLYNTKEEIDKAEAALQKVLKIFS